MDDDVDDGVDDGDARSAGRGENAAAGPAARGRGRGRGHELARGGASVVPRTAVIAGGGALAVWEPAFTLGAYDVIFYYQMLTLWAVSTAVLLAGFLMRERGPRHGWMYWACLALPSAWLVLAAVVPRSGNWQGEALFLIGGIISVIGTPLLTWVLLQLLLFGESELSAHQRRTVIGVVALVGTLAFLLGQFNGVFLTCGDFDISGNSVPSGCRPGHASPLG
ncbi:hypothetical protein [Streptomyces sp. NBC_01363]|uniref:hypothetical protein n=1 Tax=Streptomyces sp. NBC_01363 TaxID=2903840 RepID=UPI00224F693F|nr:hypothetical protein [Streptomyces sp. NBC_01363]MCX4730563.1 hypothetical protein [Streptomyces sp. NBC_01363]